MKVVNTFCDCLDRAHHIDKVSEADQPQYDLCADVWCLMVLDCSSYAAAWQLSNAIQNLGLFFCIESADEYAKLLLLDNTFSFETATLSEIWSGVIEDSYRSGHSRFAQSFIGSAFYEENSYKAAAAQILLRFPKRFTRIETDPQSSLQKFRKIHWETSVYAHDHISMWPGYYVCTLLRQVMREILIPNMSKKAWKALIDRVNGFEPFFSSGVACGPSKTKEGEVVMASLKTQTEKFQWLLDHTATFDRKGSSLGVDALYGYELPFAPPVRSRCNELLSGYAKISTVAKDYESSRVIAPNTPYLNYIGSWIRNLLIELTSATGYLALMPPEDQSLNRERARLGSMPSDDPYVTLDLSHASDSIARSFFEYLCPNELWPLIEPGLEKTLWIEGEEFKPALIATSGNKLTPILQSTFFLTILCTACDLCGKPRDVSAYNDDLICRQSVAQTAIELLERCGATVNKKKSFTSGCFRESCGGEYCYGVDVTGFYWPRSALRLRPTDMNTENGAKSLESLISLQHKLYDFPSCRARVESAVLSLKKDMTFSPVGSDCSDLWASHITQYKSMLAKHYYLSSKPSKVPANQDAGIALYDFYRYLRFLKYGPRYASPLDQLLGVSEADTDASAIMSVAWELRPALVQLPKPKVDKPRKGKKQNPQLNPKDGTKPQKGKVNQPQQPAPNKGQQKAGGNGGNRNVPKKPSFQNAGKPAQGKPKIKQPTKGSQPKQG